MDDKTLNLVKKTLDLRILEDTNVASQNYLPKPVAKEIIKYITDANWCRKIFSVIKMKKRVLPIPVISSGRTSATNGVYYVARGVDISTKNEGNFIRLHSNNLEAKKLMAYASVDNEDIEDSDIDVIKNLFLAFGEAFGEAEEYSFLLGQDDGTLPADNPAQAFVGLVKLAKDAGLIVPAVLSMSANDSVIGIENALSLGAKALGKYGKNRGKLITFVDSNIAEALRRSNRLVTVDPQGIRQDLGPAGMQAAIVAGTKVYESAYLAGTQAGKIGMAIITPSNEPIIGDRELIKIVPQAIPESDKIRYIISERVAFGVRHTAYSAGLAGNAEAVALVTFTGSLT